MVYLLPSIQQDLEKMRFPQVTPSRLAKLANFETADMIVSRLHSYLREIGEVKEVSFEGLQFEYKRQLMTCHLLLLIILTPFSTLIPQSFVLAGKHSRLSLR